MIKRQVTIINKLGLHARAAAKFVSTAAEYQCNILVEKDGKQVDAKSIMSVMMLAASQGTMLEIILEGDDEAEAFLALAQLINDRFHEEQ